MSNVADIAEFTAAIEARQARIAELHDQLTVARVEREREVRESLRTKPKILTSFGGSSPAEKKIRKLEEELEHLEAELPLLIEESAEVRAEAARVAAREALAKYDALTDQEYVAFDQLRLETIALVERWLETVPEIRKQRDAYQNEVEALCREAGMSDDFTHAWNEAQSRALPGAFLGQCNRAIRSIKVGDLKQGPAARVWESPELLFGVTPAEQSPTYVEPVSTRTEWVDVRSARMVDGLHDWKRQDGGPREGLRILDQAPTDVYELLETGQRRWEPIDV